MSRRFLGVGRLTRVVIWGLLAAAALPVLAGASTLQTSTDFAFPPDFVNPCNGEPIVDVQGTVHIATQPDVAGGVKVQTNTQGVTGIGGTSGLSYTISEETHSYTLLPNEDLFDYRKIIRRGETGEILDDDAYMLIHESFSVFSDPAVPTFSTECR